MNRRPPTSPLFPDPTLFRPDRPAAKRPPGEQVGDRRASSDTEQRRRRRGRASERERAAQDRKSTRLNSSHANISYAVFCLKRLHREKNIPGADVALEAEY